MNDLYFTIESFQKVYINNNNIYKIKASYYNSMGEPIDSYLLSKFNYGFYKDNSYKCNIVKEVNNYIYIDNIEQIDIDINIKKEIFEQLNSYIDNDDILMYLSLNSHLDIKNQINNSNYINKEFILEKILNAYHSNYLVKKLNNFNLEINKYKINEILNKYREIDIKELFENNTYYLAYYFNLKYNINKLNNMDIKYSQIINSLKAFEKKGHAFVYLNELCNYLLNKYEYNINLLMDNVNYICEKGLIVNINKKIYLKYNYDIEINLINNLKNRINEKHIKLDDMAIKKIDNIIKKQHFILNKEQIDAVYNAIENNITIITGGAGVGKSTIQSCILQSIKAINNKFNIEIIAPTGKAANEVNKKIAHLNIVKAKTIHRLFEINNNDYDNVKYIKKLDYLIVDEASMLDNNIFNLIISNIPLNCKIILIGDINQCEAIGVGTPIIFLLKLKNIIKSVKLKINNRQGESNIINKNANKILKCSPTDIKFINEKFMFIENKNNIKLMSLLKKELDKLMKQNYNIEDIMILTLKNYKIENINLNVQNIYLKSLREDNEFIVKDKVIQIKNNNSKNVFNGEQGIIKYIEKSYENIVIDVDFGDKVIRYKNKSINQLKLAYGITIHKCQGSQAKIVILLIDKSDEEHLNRNIIYTAITRAIDKLIIIGDKETFNKCVCKLPEEKNSIILEELSKIS